MCLQLKDNDQQHYNTSMIVDESFADAVYKDTFISLLEPLNQINEKIKINE